MWLREHKQSFVPQTDRNGNAWYQITIFAVTVP